MAKKEKKRISKSNISFKDSIKTRLIAVMLAIAIIPLMISIIISYKTSTDKAMQDAQDSMEWQAWYIESRFVEIIDRNMDLIRQVGKNPTVTAYMKILNEFYPLLTTRSEKAILQDLQNIK